MGALGECRLRGSSSFLGPVDDATEPLTFGLGGKGRIVASKRCGASPQEGGNNRDETADRAAGLLLGCGGLPHPRSRRARV